MTARMRIRFKPALWLAGVVGAVAGPLYVALASRTAPLVGAAVILGGFVAALVLYSPYLAVVFTAAVVPLERIGRFSNDSQMITFSLMRTMGLLGAASLILNWTLKRFKLWVPLPVLIYAGYAFVGALTLSFTDDFTRGVQQTTTNVGNVIFLLLISNTIRHPRMVRLPIALWLVTTLGISIFCVYQWFNPAAVVQVDRYDNSGYRTTEERFSTVMEDYGEYELGAVKRLLGPTSSPAVYGINVILTLPFYVYFLRTSSNVLVWLFAAAGVGLGAYTVILTNTRAAVAALIFAFLWMFLSPLVRYKQAILATGVLVAASSIPFLPEALSNRLFNSRSWSPETSTTMSIRLVYWWTAVDIFEDNWFMGIGVGNQGELPKRLRNRHMPANTSAHNEYLETMLETGVVGYPFMVGFLYLFRKRLRDAELSYRHNGDEETALFCTAIRIGFATILFYALQCDVLHFTLKGFWLSVGLTMALWRLAPLPAAQEVPVEPASSSEEALQAT